MAKKDKEYQQAYYENEADANKHMSYVNGTAGLLAIVIWVLYLTKVFIIPDYFFLTVCIMFPVIAAVMFVPVFLVRTSLIRRKGYKYFILFSLLAVIAALNVAIPKHSVLFWPFAILIANHYYSPTIGRIIYGVSMVAMLLCLYLGMFFGEFDENLFGNTIASDAPDTMAERIELLNQLAAQGNNRYIKVLVYYYMPRAMILTLFFIVSNLLNRRTYKLLDKEIKTHDEQEKARTELGIAKEIQMNTLPEELVDSREVEIIAQLKPAKEVGGDLYDYLDIDEHHVGILIGDVSGKGVPAAMFMMKTLTSFRDFAAPGKTPSEILREVNASIHKGNKKSMFVTCFLAILDKRDGTLVYANAGHNPPIVGHSGNYRYLDCKSGFLLGCFKESFLVDEKTTLKPGESITLFTDGITEARNREGAFFGEERFLDAFNRDQPGSPIEIHHAIKAAMTSFVGDAPQSDDITLVTLKYLGGDTPAREKTFFGKKENIPQMLSFIGDFAKEYDFPEEFTNQLLVVGDELFSNIVKHGYENNGGDIFVRLSFNKGDNEFTLIVIDKAKAFNQLSVNNREVGTDPKTQQIGGLGILLVKKIMTEYAYDRVSDKNVLVLKKRF